MYAIQQPNYCVTLHIYICGESYSYVDFLSHPIHEFNSTKYNAFFAIEGTSPITQFLYILILFGGICNSHITVLSNWVLTNLSSFCLISTIYNTVKSLLIVGF